MQRYVWLKGQATLRPSEGGLQNQLMCEHKAALESTMLSIFNAGIFALHCHESKTP
jgi:hypothetical protein